MIKAGSGALVSTHSRAAEKIVAYTLLIRYADRTGKPTGMGTQNNVFGLGVESGRDGLAAGEVWSPQRPAFLPVHNDDKSPVNPKIEVDYVLFEDGSAWGPDTLHQSLHITGLRQGFSTCLRQLRTVLDKQGPQAALRAIERDRTSAN